MCHSHPRASSPTLQPATAPQILHVQGAHVRFEEEAKEGPASPELPVALGVCLSEILLELDTRAEEKATGRGVPGRRWFGQRFRRMEVALLGNFCECLLNAWGGGSLTIKPTRPNLENIFAIPPKPIIFLFSSAGERTRPRLDKMVDIWSALLPFHDILCEYLLSA